MIRGKSSYSITHYLPITTDIINVVFCENKKKDDLESFVKKYNLKVIRKVSSDTWKFKVINEKDFVKLYTKVFNDIEVGYVYCNYQFDLSPGSSEE